MKKLTAIICIVSMLCAFALSAVADTNPQERDADIFDALEILKELVGITPNNALELTGKEDLSVFDALEILKGLVGITEAVKVYCGKPVHTTEPSATTTPDITTEPPTTTTPGETNEPPVTTTRELNPNEIPFRVISSGHGAYNPISAAMKLFIIKSHEELEQAALEIGDKYSRVSPPDKWLPYDFGTFDSDYFEEKALIVLRDHLEHFSHTFNTLTKVGDKLVLNVNITYDGVVIMYPATVVKVIEVNKSDIIGVNSVELDAVIENVTVYY